MRTIKFRAWDKETKQMCIVQYLTTDLHICQIWNGKNGDMPDDENEGIMVRDWNEVELMQYTGLKDNTHWSQLTKQEKQDWISKGETNQTWKGKEVYEGDIVRATIRGETFITKQGIIKWSDYLKALVVNIFGEHIDDSNTIGIFYELEVIGNKWENPELI